ncbi:MAG: GNAT family N-acetyltransferase [Nocardioides sp.]
MLIAPLDASDDEALAGWHAAYLAADTAGRDHATPWMLPEMRADFLGERTGEQFLPFAGYVDGQVVSDGLVVLHRKENLDIASLKVWTHPSRRGVGYGSAMLEHVTEVARDAGRTVLSTEVAVPFDGPADGAGHPDADFIVRRGFAFDIGDVVRVLDLPADRDRLRELSAQAAPYHADYTLRRFLVPVPDDILAQFGELIGSLMTEAPSGELARDGETMDEERIRADERVFEASGRTKYTTVAVAPDGDVVAYSELVVPRHDPLHVYQWGTLVRPAHRGHRLGLATKAHNLLWLQQEEPGPATLVTMNAEVNGHMIGVNEALGFRPVERLAEFAKRLG